jgi:hypothetical protein
MKSITRLLDLPLDIESDIYQEQLDHLTHGIVTDQFKGLLGASWRFKVGQEEFLQTKEINRFNLRNELILVDRVPRIFLFTDDVCESLFINDKLIKISLLEKGEFRLKAEEMSNIFNPKEYIYKCKNNFMMSIKNIKYEIFNMHEHQGSYIKLGILNPRDILELELSSDPEMIFKSKVNEFLNNSLLTNRFEKLFPDAYFMRKFESIINFIEFPSKFDAENMLVQYEELYDKYERS